MSSKIKNKKIRKTINKRKRNEREIRKTINKRKGNKRRTRIENESRKQKVEKNQKTKLKNLTNKQVTNNFGKIIIKN